MFMDEHCLPCLRLFFTRALYPVSLFAKGFFREYAGICSVVKNGASCAINKALFPH